MREHSGRNAARVLGALASVAVLCGCGGTESLPAHEVFGARTSTPLTLDRATVTGTAVAETQARRLVRHPFAAPELRGLRQFGLARVTAAGLAAEDSSPPRYDDRLAWVGIYEVKTPSEHSCPGRPQPLPSSLPPVFDHYYFAVLVDAASGQQATWNEDMSGLLLRDCAGGRAR